MSTYYVADTPYSDELYHHGIKGQKWGIRRYQNEDRTLTLEGKQRYGMKNKKSNGTKIYKNGKVRLDENGNYDVKHYVNAGILDVAGKTIAASLQTGAALYAKKMGISFMSKQAAVYASITATSAVIAGARYYSGAKKLKKLNAQKIDYPRKD